MNGSMTHQLIAAHLVSGELIAGSEISIRIDQTLTQDALGTMAFLEFEAIGVERVRTKLSVSYVDHLTLQEGFENSDDHHYLMTVADRYGVLFSKPGNGICHQVHLERLTRPGWTLLGSDSHTPTAGGVGMLAIGAGGLDVAVAMAGGPFFLACPQVVRVDLHGRLRPWVTAKDVILEILKRMTTKGNVGRVLEYGGPGVETLTVPERATIANMGAELGVTTSVFPSDRVTRAFFKAQGRAAEWAELRPEPGAAYDRTIELELDAIEPNIALPHSPDNVRRIREVAGTPVDQVLIGSCTNSSYRDLMTVAAMLKGRKAHPAVSFGVAPGTRQVLRMISANGALTDMVDAGARVLEPVCGFCVGNGQSPRSGAVSVRGNNRNFEGRSGTQDAQVYLASPESAVAAALTGRITDPRDLGMDYPVVPQPERFFTDADMFVAPTFSATVFRGPNMGPPPGNTAMPAELAATVAIKLGDKVTTDHIIPAGSAGRFRSNIAKSSEFVFRNVDPEFPARCAALKGRGRSAVIVAGLSYGQGSSREHAAICPMFLGVRAVLARSVERIHLANLVNFGIMPLIFGDPADYERLQAGDELEIADTPGQFGRPEVTVTNRTRGESFTVSHTLTPRQVEIVLCGGLLNYVGRKSAPE
jgi:aconitate hydratase